MIMQSLKMAMSAVMSSKMRSFLTMLGIIIGVIALVVLVSLVNGATDSVTEQIYALGTDMLTVSVLDDKNQPLRLSDLEAMGENPEIDLVAPISQTPVTMKYGRDSTNVTMQGTTSSYYEIQNMEMGTGRFLRTADVDNASYVTVLSYEAADDLFGRTDVTGEEVVLNGMHFLVVGVLAESENVMFSFGSQSVYVPFSVAARMSGSSYVTTFYATATNPDTLDNAELAMDGLLMNRFRQDEDAFRVINQSTIMDAMGSITDTLTLLLGGIAAISLLVGGIGIMNIMLVSVTERTREIGIRKAIGARKSSIKLQFLIEALVLSLAGCAIGILLSWGILSVVGMIADDSLKITMSPDIVLVAVLFATGVGVLFGMYPANKAANMRPIDALRTA